MDPCTTDTKTLLKQLTAQYYDDLNHAHERGQKVGVDQRPVPPGIFF